MILNYKLPPLDYSYNALEPFIDAETMLIHHTKHHQAYIDNCNTLHEKYNISEGKESSNQINNIILQSPDKEIYFNNLGGYMNHNLFWTYMTDDKDKRILSHFMDSFFNTYFESFENFKNLFSLSAKSLFGSGWTWLIYDYVRKKFEIINTKNQQNPLLKDFSLSHNQLMPILGLDVWEHAYYLKYQSKRIDYIQNWFNVINWNHIEYVIKHPDL